LGSSAPNATNFFIRGVLTTSIQPQSTRGCRHLSGPDSQRLGTGLSWPDQSWQGRKGDSRDVSTFVTSCPIGMSLPADSSCEGRVSLHFMQPGLSMPTAAGVVDEKGSEYILAHTGPRELDGHPLGECGSGFGLVPGYTTLLVRVRAKTHFGAKYKKCENERTNWKVFFFSHGFAHGRPMPWILTITLLRV